MMDAVEVAARLFANQPIMRIDCRDMTYFLVAATLMKTDASEEERLRALSLLETELYPKGRRDSLVKALTGKRPRERRARKRGGDPLAYFTRDVTIVYAIKTVCEMFELKPLRSRAAKDKGGAASGCSVVVEALQRVEVHLTEAAIEKIWNQRHSLWPVEIGPIPQTLRI